MENNNEKNVWKNNVGTEWLTKRDKNYSIIPPPPRPLRFQRSENCLLALLQILKHIHVQCTQIYRCAWRAKLCTIILCYYSYSIFFIFSKTCYSCSKTYSCCYVVSFEFSGMPPVTTWQYSKPWQSITCQSYSKTCYSFSIILSFIFDNYVILIR